MPVPFGTRKDKRRYPKRGEVIPESVLQNMLAEGLKDEEKFEAIWNSLRKSGLSAHETAHRLAHSTVSGLMKIYGISHETAVHIHETAKISDQSYERPGANEARAEEARRIRKQFSDQGFNPDDSGYIDPDKNPEEYR